MTSLPNNYSSPGAAGRPSVLGRVFADRQFVVAAMLLLTTALVWPTAIAAMDWAMIKTPVVWPEGVQVSDDFRLLSLPAQLGRFRLAGDGEVSRHRDGKPAGENVINPDQRLILGVGTPEDAPRLPARSSNWYVSRFYIDTDPKVPNNSPLKVWQLDVTYYTGAVDKVAHVPGRCMTASGFVPAGSEQDKPFSLTSAGPWQSPVRCIRACFVKGSNPLGGGQLAQYYTFSLNGDNEPSWKVVRLHMSSRPWEKSCYFAKIQFCPVRSVNDLPSCDQAAGEFLNSFLPAVIRALPSATRIEQLNHPSKGMQAKHG